MSYFKGQDGGQSQVTSFYRSTPQTSRLPSRARQKAALLHSTGKLPHQTLHPPRASATVAVYLLHALHLHHTVKNPSPLNCLWIFIAASTEIKDGTDSVDCYWFVQEQRFLDLNARERKKDYATIQQKDRLQKSDCLIEHPFLIEKSLSIFSLSCDVELESRGCYCGWWICQLLRYEWG